MKKYILRNHVPRLFPADPGIKHTITARTPAWSEFFRSECAEHFHDLLSGIIRVHHKEVSEIPDVQEMCVPGEKAPVLLHCQFHKIAVLYIRKVEGIKTEKSQPTGETAEHGICDKTHVMEGFIVHAQQLIPHYKTGRPLDITLLMPGKTPDLCFRSLRGTSTPPSVLLFRYWFRGSEWLQFPLDKGITVLLHP